MAAAAPVTSLRRDDPEMARSLLLLLALPLSYALYATPHARIGAPPTQHRIPALQAVVNYEVEEGGEARATPLSDDFDGAVQDAANGLLGAIQDGSLKLRLDFDTSMGDETYTKLKLSTEFARDVAIEWALAMAEDENLVLFFPDAGAAALARQEWKMDNLEEAEVPPNVRVKAFPRDRLDADDKAVFALCPRAPERDACEELVNTCAETMRPVACCVEEFFARALHAIEQTRLREHLRVGGVETPHYRVAQTR